MNQKYVRMDEQQAIDDMTRGLSFGPEIAELDINPLIVHEEGQGCSVPIAESC